MKYLKLYEANQRISLKGNLKYSYPSNYDLSTVKEFSCCGCNLDDLDGIENFTNLEFLDCSDNNLTNLKGVETLKKLNEFYCYRNKLTSLEEIKDSISITKTSFFSNNLETIDILNLTNLTWLCCSDCNITSVEGIESLINLNFLYCHINKITSLKGVEKLTNLKELYCYDNKLTNLEELRNLALNRIQAYDNPLEVPLPYNVYNVASREHFNIYSGHQAIMFSSYDFQKEFIEEHPEKILDLKPIGFDDKIKEEYKDLIEFFNIKL